MRVVIKFIFKIFAIIMYRPKILGKENLPEEGGALLCPNHVHNLDAAIIVAMFKRKVNVLAKEELFKNKFLCWIADLFGIYPVKREKADIGGTGGRKPYYDSLRSPPSSGANLGGAL